MYASWLEKSEEIGHVVYESEYGEKYEDQLVSPFMNEIVCLADENEMKKDEARANVIFTFIRVCGASFVDYFAENDENYEPFRFVLYDSLCNKSIEACASEDVDSKLDVEQEMFGKMPCPRFTM